MNRQLAASVANAGTKYDEAAAMLTRDIGRSVYHSRCAGVVHPTCDSLVYAAALLRAGVFPGRAQRILSKVLPMQDLDPNSLTYGLWPWYLEESLAEMDPPDYNWADFCGQALLECIDAGYDKETLKKHILAACACIKKRDVQPSYTNICAMGAYVTMAAGCVYENEEYFAYGKQRLKNFEAYGSFDEYNSPNYTLILIEELTRVQKHVPDGECYEIATRLLDKAWKMAAEHFHPETMQWAGPVSRSYATLLPSNIKASLLCAVYGMDYDCGDAVMGLDGCLVGIQCPPQYRHFYEKTEAPRWLVEKVNGMDTAYAYITPQYALGTTGYSDFWNQKRPMVAYWGSAKAPSYCAVRVLHDGFDYCAATLHATQDKGRMQGVITFETEGGDTHPSLDRIKDGKIQAEDLRILFEYYNSEPKHLTVTEAVFDGKPVAPTVTEEGVAYILYHGERTTVDFKALGESRLAFAFDMEEE